MARFKKLYETRIASVAELEKLLDRPDKSGQTTPSSLKKDSEDYNGRLWYETDSLDEARGLMRTGWAEGRERINELTRSLRERIERSHGVAQRPVLMAAPVGFMPNVPGAVANIVPASMLRWEGVDSDQARIVKLTINLSVSANVSTKTIENRGAAAAALVELLELTGTRVEVVVACGIANHPAKDKQGIKGALQTIIIKQADVPMDTDRLAFHVMHPSSFRRIMFRLLENNPAPGAQEAARTRLNYGWPEPIPSDDPQYGDIHIGELHSGQFKNEAAAMEWVMAHLKEQGVTFD